MLRVVHDFIAHVGKLVFAKNIVNEHVSQTGFVHLPALNLVVVSVLCEHKHAAKIGNDGGNSHHNDGFTLVGNLKTHAETALYHCKRTPHFNVVSACTDRFHAQSKRVSERVVFLVLRSAIVSSCFTAVYCAATFRSRLFACVTKHIAFNSSTFTLSLCGTLLALHSGDTLRNGFVFGFQGSMHRLLYGGLCVSLVLLFRLAFVFRCCLSTHTE